MTRPFEVREVGPDALSSCHAIRHEVFVLGQGVPSAIEVDGRDPVCVHVLATLNDEVPVGTARLREHEGHAKAERVAVLEAFRGLGIGEQVMHALEEIARRQGHDALHLHAQEQVVPFYERIGYTAFGARFFEAGIPHRAMVKQLR
jgi:predicted GNAT family N-acyltransferase